MKLFRRKTKEMPKLHWGDMTIAKYKKIMDLYDNRKEDEDNILFLYSLTAAAYGKDEDWIDGMKISEANKYADTLAFIKERPKPNLIKSHYILNGTRYNVSMNPQAVTTAQYLDFQQMADKASIMPAEFLSILLIPKGKKYNDGYEISDVVRDIENYMSIEDALGLSAFFFNLLRISMRLSLRKLKRMERKLKKEGVMDNDLIEGLKRVRDLLESANGMKQWMR